MSGIHARLYLQRPDFLLDVDLQLPAQGVTALFGPSGCGKTSCLRAIAGLERASGQVQVNGTLWQDDAAGLWLPTHQRQLGYVFQEASLFAHLNVLRNMQYGLQRLPPAQRRVSLEQAIELLGLEHLLARQPHSLSGGERQRVAIARALAASPRLLLLDEPLAALDAARKAEVLPYLERLQRQLQIPMLYVSHAPDEVARLAQHLVLLDQGRVLAQGATSDLLTRLDLPLAQGDNAAAVLEVKVDSYNAPQHLLSTRFDGGQIQLITPKTYPPGQRLRLRIQARDVSLALSRASDSSILNLLPARISALSDDGAGQVLLALQLGGTAAGAQLLARISVHSCQRLQLRPGQAVFAQIKAVALLD